MIEITIDQDGCIECGSCGDACGNVFEAPSGDKAKIVEDYRTDNPAEGEVGGDLESCARSAAEVCPVDVITLK